MSTTAIITTTLPNETLFVINSTTSASPVPITGLTVTDIVLGIGLFFILLGVGVSLDWKLFKHIVQTKTALKAAVTGLCVQFTLMPICAYLLTLIFDPGLYQSFGMICMGIVPGGSISNTFCLMSKGSLELSTFMTLVSTILGFAMIPLLLFLFGNLAVGIDSSEVDYLNLAIGLCLLLVPLSIGILVRKKFPNSVAIFEKVTTIGTVVFIFAAVIIISIDNSDVIFSSWRIWVPAAFYFFLPGGIGYFLTRIIFKFSPAVSRTILFEVALQNSSLAWSIIAVSIRSSIEDRTDAIRFPLVYSFFQYFWGGCMIFYFRHESKTNLEKGIEDIEADFDRMKEGMMAEEKENDDDYGGNANDAIGKPLLVENGDDGDRNPSSSEEMMNAVSGNEENPLNKQEDKEEVIENSLNVKSRIKDDDI